MSLTDAVQHLKSDWDTFTCKVVRPENCLFCGALRVWWNGYRERTASVSFEGVVHFLTGIRCRRAKCRDCHHGWTLIPPGLSPNRHYQLCVVASAASNYLFDSNATQATIAQEHQCSERTVGRWLRWVSQLAAPGVLQRQLLELTGAPILAQDPDVKNLVRKARHGNRRDSLPLAAQILALFEALGVAMGMEPPGLRGVLERVIGNRSRIATYQTPLIPELAR